MKDLNADTTDKRIVTWEESKRVYNDSYWMKPGSYELLDAALVKEFRSMLPGNSANAKGFFYADWAKESKDPAGRIAAYFSSSSMFDITQVFTNGGWQHTSKLNIPIGMPVYILPSLEAIKVAVAANQPIEGAKFILAESSHNLEKACKHKGANKAEIIQEVIKREEIQKQINNPFEEMAVVAEMFGKFSMQHYKPGRLDGLMDSRKFDHIYIRGATIEAIRTGEREREHAIPCNMVRDRGIELCRLGASRSEVVQHFTSSCIIIHETAAERYKLDRECGWRDNMPPGWDWGMNPYQRFKEAGIQLQ